MNKKIIKLALLGKTNAGKSTLLNTLVGEKISIANKKINTTQESIIGIKNIKNIQIIFFDTPGTNFLKTSNILQKKLKTNIWQSINDVDQLIYLVDVIKYKFSEVKKDILKIAEIHKPIILIFNKIDQIENKYILSYIEELRKINFIKDFFLISAKFDKGIDALIKYITIESKEGSWLYKNDEITNKDDIYITNECTRNAILEYLHKEIPYNIIIKNIAYKHINKKELKIKQLIELNNERHKGIILGKNGQTIKRIREKSQFEINQILDNKIHLYLQVLVKNEK